MWNAERIKKYCKENEISVGKYLWLSVSSKIDGVKKQVHEKKRDKKIDLKNQQRLENKTPSIISINCNGCTIAHDLGLRFNTQFVNLWLYPKDFIKYISNLDYYNSLPITFVESKEYDYPVGKVGDIYVYFMHYATNEEAEKKWEERKKRTDKENLFVMMTDQEGCTEEDMEAFDVLPYKNKIIFTHIPMPQIKSSFYIKGFENDKSVGKLNGYIDDKSVYKWYDQFDYVEWFNTGKIKRKE